MTALEAPTEIAAAAYRLTTDGALTRPTPWQSQLYDLLSQPNRDAADLLLTPTGAGKTEAVLIPSLGLQRGGAPRRLFFIASEESPLDDPLQRIVPYLCAWVAADETPRTLCLDTDEEDDEENQCRRFYPDGTEDPHVITNPLEADVDLILTTLPRFQSLFFGAGGVHALPSALPTEQSGEPLRRDLFFFDEAHSYQPDAFARFHRLVEFLFAEDADLIVASTTMPAAYQDELTFLDPIQVSPVPSGLIPSPQIFFSYRPIADFLTEAEAAIQAFDPASGSVTVVFDQPDEAESVFQRLQAACGDHLKIYHHAQPAAERRKTYADLREREQMGKPTILLTSGPALETSDLDACTLLTRFCPPENLIRRAGRCNRRGRYAEGQLIVIGNEISPIYRLLPLGESYRSHLTQRSGMLFKAEDWKQFI